MLKRKLAKSWQLMRLAVRERPIVSNIYNTKQNWSALWKNNTYVQRFRQSPWALFTRELLTNPRSIGAACPSSAYLARAMAAQACQYVNEGLVLELGAGTGRVTEALVKSGIDPQRLIIVERSASLSQHLRQRFPELRILEGDAGQLKQLLGTDFDKVSVIVSSLPLRSLPQPVVLSITQHFVHLLKRGAVLVQFTYDLRSPGTDKVNRQTTQRFTRIASKIIWQNLPPARVDVFCSRHSR